MDFQDLDVLGMFESGSADIGAARDADDVSITYAHYRAVVGLMAQRLGVSAEVAWHLFNVDTPPPTSESVPLCVHMTQECVSAYLHHEDRLPTVTCRFVPTAATKTADAVMTTHHTATGTRTRVTTTVADRDAANGLIDSACKEGPPHVHCLFCLRHALECSPPARPGVPPPAVDELTRSDDETGVPLWYTHFAQHERRKHKYWGMLDEEVIAYLGESGDEFDLDTEEGQAACEEAAALAARHGCFIVSAGTAACPLVLFYCAYCAQFAPLVELKTTKKEKKEEDYDDDEEEEADSVEVVLTTGAGTHLTWPILLAKLFIGFHFWRQRAPAAAPSRDDERTGHRSDAHEDDETPYVFLYQPELFQSEADVEAFEEDVMCTYGSAILPGAEVMTRQSDTDTVGDAEGTHHARPCLVLSPAKDVSAAALAERPLPYTFRVATEGFLMAWSTPAEARDKCVLALTRDNGDVRLQLTQRLVYVPELTMWVRAHVLYHDVMRTAAAEEEEAYQATSVHWVRYQESDSSCAIRVGYNVVVETAVQSSATTAAETGAEANVGELEADDDEVTAIAMAAAPFSLEARTIDFFGRMTLFAKAMAESSHRLKAAPRADGDEIKGSPL